MVGCSPVVFDGIGLLTLLVYGCRKIIHKAGTGLIIGRQQVENLDVGKFGRFIILQLIGRVGAHQPGGQPDLLIRSGVILHEPGPRRKSLFIILHGEKIFSRRSQNNGRLFMVWKVVDKFDRYAHNLLFHIIFSLRRRCFELFAKGIDRCVAGFRGFIMQGVIVSRLFILRGCRTEIVVLQQQVRQLIVDSRRFFFRWERDQKFAVPVHSLFEMVRSFFLFLWFLVSGMVVMSQIG